MAAAAALVVLLASLGATPGAPLNAQRPRAGDLGLRKAVSLLVADGRPLSIEEVRALGERFAPFRNLSAHYLLAGARMAG